MFLSRRISMLLLSVSCCFASLQADFVALSVWERTIPSGEKQGEKQHLGFFGDRYDLSTQATEQDLDILNFLAKRNCSSDVLDKRLQIMKTPFLAILEATDWDPQHPLYKQLYNRSSAKN